MIFVCKIYVYNMIGKGYYGQATGFVSEKTRKAYKEILSEIFDKSEVSISNG